MSLGNHYQRRRVMINTMYILYLICNSSTGLSIVGIYSDCQNNKLMGILINRMSLHEDEELKLYMWDMCLNSTMSMSNNLNCKAHKYLYYLLKIHQDIMKDTLNCLKTSMLKSNSMKCIHQENSPNSLNKENYTWSKVSIHH